MDDQLTSLLSHLVPAQQHVAPRDLIRYPFSPEERRELRVEIDRRRRIRVKKEARLDVSHRRNMSTASSAARMEPEQVEVAFRSYQDGVTIEELADVLWRKHGFSSVGRCAHSLRQRFVSLGLLTEAA